MKNQELSAKVFSFLDSPEWVLSSDLSGIELKVNGNKITISFECAQCICWNGRSIEESIDWWLLKKIRYKGRSIFNKLQTKRLEGFKKEHAEFIQTVLQEMNS